MVGAGPGGCSPLSARHPPAPALLTGSPAAALRGLSRPISLASGLLMAGCALMLLTADREHQPVLLSALGPVLLAAAFGLFLWRGWFLWSARRRS